MLMRLFTFILLFAMILGFRIVTDWFIFHADTTWELMITGSVFTALIFVVFIEIFKKNEYK